MPNVTATDLINQQIATELDKLNSILTVPSEKPAIMQRIAELKAMVENDPTPVKKAEPPTVRELISDLIVAIRNR